MGFFSKLFNNANNDSVLATSSELLGEKFSMTIEDAFPTGKGIILTGKINSGEIHVGDNVIISGTKKNAEVMDIERFRRHYDYAQVGDNCGILLKDVSLDDINKGDILTKEA